MRYFALLLISLSLLGCKQQSGETTQSTDKVTAVVNPTRQNESTDADKIARRHGIENWTNVEKIAFTFNVDREGAHMDRSFVWNVKTDDVSTYQDGKTVTYNRNQELDDQAKTADRQFINDTYWLLAPFKLVWDDHTTLSPTLKAKAPISGSDMNMISIQYGDQGGYTPGDAYDIYFDDSYTIREWTYRKGGQQEPSMITTWEDYREIGGLQISMMRNDITETFNIYFTDVKVN